MSNGSTVRTQFAHLFQERPPAGLPESVASEWRMIYELQLEANLHRWPHDPELAKRKALHGVHDAVLRTPKLNSAEEALALEEWRFVHRDLSADRKTLNVVTRDGEKYSFPVSGEIGEIRQ